MKDQRGLLKRLRVYSRLCVERQRAGELNVHPSSNGAALADLPARDLLAD